VCVCDAVSSTASGGSPVRAHTPAMIVFASG
jgi:hypothetical protein